MDPPVVYIEKEPFLNMIWSAVESFNRECLGFIFGKKPSKKRNIFIIENAINIQLARERENLKVHQSRASSDRTDSIIKKYKSLYPFIGDFHSHPEWRKHQRVAMPSDLDRIAIREDDIDLSIIIKTSTINKDRPIWESVNGGGVQGSLDRYKFHINAFSMVSDSSGEKQLQMLEILASPAIKALNKALGYK